MEDLSRLIKNSRAEYLEAVQKQLGAPWLASLSHFSFPLQLWHDCQGMTVTSVSLLKFNKLSLAY